MTALQDNSRSHSRARAVALDALLLALAMLLSYVERLLPLSFALPGMKLGLANVAVMYAFFHAGRTHGALVSLLRVLLMTLLFGQASSFLFALFGALLSLLTLFAFSYAGGRFSRVAISVACAAAHGVGQVLAAMLLYGSAALLSYLPYLLLAALPFGALCGVILLLCERLLPRGVLL